MPARPKAKKGAAPASKPAAAGGKPGISAKKPKAASPKKASPKAAPKGSPKAQAASPKAKASSPKKAKGSAAPSAKRRAVDTGAAKPEAADAPAQLPDRATKRCPTAAAAAEALLAYMAGQGKTKKLSLTPDEDSVCVHVHLCHSIPDKLGIRRHMTALPHPIFSEEETEVCLITPEPQRTFKDLVKQHGVTCVKKVIDINKLQKKFKSFEQKRTLLRSFDVFMCGSSLWHRMPALLGKKFFEHNKEPLSIQLNEFPRSVHRALRTTSFRWTENTCISVKIASPVGFTPQQIAENACAVLDAVVRGCPNGWADVRGAGLKSSQSPLLPIYAHDFTEAEGATAPKYPRRQRLQMPAATKRTGKKRPADDDDSDDDGSADAGSEESRLSKLSGVDDDSE